MIRQTKRLLNGGLDTDSAPKYIAPEDYSMMLNCHNGVSKSHKHFIVQNVNGNRVVSFTLPAGVNKTIGRFEDTKNETCIFLVQNSLGNHSILRYYLSTDTIIPVIQETLLGFTVPVGSINLVDGLFSFTDGVVPQRSFNIERAQRQDANGVFKKVKFNIYFDFTNFRNGDTYSISYTNVTPQLIQVFTSASDQTLEAGVTDFVTQFNAAQGDFLATSCGQFVEVEAITAGIYDVVLVVDNNMATGLPSSPALRVFTNIYPYTSDGFTFLETFINADKNPPICNPTTSFGNDITKKANYVTGRDFEFALAYRYVDHEISSASARSIVTAQLHALSNFVKVDFTDSRLTDGNLTIISGVDIFVREGELGKWKRVKTLERYEFGIADNYFNFFNDQIYPELDDAYVVKNFESIPITSEAQEVADNRMMYGGNTEGYDPVCPEFSLSVSYQSQPKTYTIRGISVIRNIFASHPYYAAITNALPSGETSYGFVGFEAPPDNLTPNGASLLYQRLPVNGHVFYLSGTNMYGIAKQYISNSAVQNTNGVFNFTTAGLNWIISQQRTASGKAQDPFGIGYTALDQNGNKIADNLVGSNSTNLFQIWEITGIPEGEYVIRIAGQETTQAALQAADYQSTSTNVIAIGTAAMGGGAIQPLYQNGFEYKIKVGDNEIAYDAVTAVNNNNILYVGCSAIADVSYKVTPTFVSGYICDSDLFTSTGNYANILSDTRIHRAIVNLNYLPSPFVPATLAITPYTIPSSWSYELHPYLQSVTDHNGYFYYGDRHNALPYPSVNQVQIGQDVFNPTSAYFSDNTPYTPFNPINSGGYFTIAFKIGVFAVPNTGLEKEYDRTFAFGNVSLANNVPVQDIAVTNTFGEWERTDQNGDYRIPVYRDTFKEVEMGLTTPPEQEQLRTGAIVFSSLDATYAFDFTVDEVAYSILIDAANYNAASSNVPIYSRYLPIANNIAVQSLLSNLISSFKSGNREFFGIIYYDRENRQTTVLTTPDGEIYFKFYTESPFPTGFPQVGWSITSLPPSWATHWQWVRTHAVPQFLQWTAKSASPVDINGNVVPYLTAQFIRIDIQGILEYQQKFPNSQISYTWQEGDRIRLISDGTNNLTNYIDEEIVKTEVTSTAFYIYVEKTNINFTVNVNSLFEIYSPNKVNTATQYFEFGECFEVLTNQFGFKVHQGLTQDQTTDASGNVLLPATGTLRTGDVYYRFRNYPQGGTKFIEDASVSDFFPSFTTQTGRPQILDKNAKQVFRPTLIRFSNQYFSGSQTNGFSSFEALNQKEIDRVFGTIRIMSLMAQSVLLVVCQHKTQTFYVNKATINIPSNTPNLISLSDAVLNQADTLIGEWGISHKLSFDSYNNHAYWFDESKGTVIRYSSNGLFPISSYKMMSYFNDRGLIHNPNVSAGFDAYFDEYIISFGDLINKTGETVAFNEGGEGGKDRWTTFYSFLPDALGKIGNTLLSFKDGDLYIHDNSIMNNFYGTQFNSEFTAVGNDNPSEVELWQAVSEESTDIWEMDMTIPPNVTKPLGQRSVLVRANFRPKEGMLYSEILRDMNTVNMLSIQDALANGDRMRGEMAQFKFTNTNTSLVELFAVNFIIIYSPLSNNQRG